MSTQPISSQITEIRNESMMHGPQSSAQSTESAVMATQSRDRAERSQLGVFMIMVLSFVAGIFMASRASGQAAFPYDSVAMPEGLKVKQSSGE